MKKFILLGVILSSCGSQTTDDRYISALKSPVIILAKTAEQGYSSRVTLIDGNGELYTTGEGATSRTLVTKNVGDTIK